MSKSDLYLDEDSEEETEDSFVKNLILKVYYLSPTVFV